MTWEASRRNFDGVQHEQIRKAIDGKFNDVHDRLSAAYYNGGTFTQGDKVVDFGKLKASDPASAKQIFDELHGMIFSLRDIAFSDENQKLSAREKIVEENLPDVAETLTRIAELKAKGVELVI